MSDHDIALWTFIITTVGVVVGLAALFAAWLTIRDNTKTAKAQFWIMLRGVFAWYDDIHANFRPGGKWSDPNTGPETALDMGRTELYMGLFEYCDTLLEQGLIDEHTFARSYKYRLQNLVSNQWVIVEKLRERREGWRAFINLCCRLHAQPPDVPELTVGERSELYSKGNSRTAVRS